MLKPRKGGEVPSRMITAQLSTTETQLIKTIMTLKFGMGKGAKLRRPPSRISRLGLAKNISTIDHN